MPKQTISKDTPLSEITLRRYEKPYDLTGRDLVKKLCLSLGLLQPGDSRDVVVDVLQVLLEKKSEKKNRITILVRWKIISSGFFIWANEGVLPGFLLRISAGISCGCNFSEQKKIELKISKHF